MLPNKNLLIPGPWNANGNTVRDGTGRTVCVVFTRNATAHAHWIAELPNLIEATEDLSLTVHEKADLAESAAECEKLEREYDVLLSKHDRLQDKVDELEDQIAELRLQLARQNSPQHI